MSIYYLIDDSQLEAVTTAVSTLQQYLDELKDLVSLADFARIAGLHFRGATNAARAGLIPVARIGRHIYVKRADALAYRKKTWNKRKPQPPRIG